MAGNTVRILAVLDDKITSGLGKIHDKFNQLGKSQGFKSVLQGVGMGAGINAYNMIGTAIGAVAGFAADSAKKASDLNETLAKNTVVFGENAAEVAGWGGTLAKSFGISKRAGVEAAASFGNVFTNIGITRAEAAKMSKTLVELAGDLASFNNIGTDEALEKLRAGLAGEAEPLRSVGVFLTEAKVKAKAMELGLVGLNGEVSESAKITARYRLILEQTSSAQGDFARTSDGLANSQRALDAQLENAQARFGQAIIPLQLEATKGAAGLLDQINMLGTGFDFLTGKTDASNLSTEQQLELLDQMESAYPQARVEIEAARNALEAQADKQANLNRQMERGKDGLKGVNNATASLTPKMRSLSHELAKSTRNFEDLTSAADKWSDWIYDNVQGVDDLKHELDLANDELKTELKHLHELEGIKNPTKDQRTDIKETRVRVDELERRTFKLNAQLSALGNRPSRDALRPYLNSLFDKMRLGIITAREYRDALDALGFRRPGARQTGKDSRGRHGDERAFGGPVTKDMAYLVGEQGPELFVPQTGGKIIPNNQMSGAVGGTNIFVNVQASGVLTPAAAQKLANDLGPTIATYLRRQQLIPARV